MDHQQARGAPCQGVRIPYVFTSRSVTSPDSRASTTSTSRSRPVNAAAETERFIADIGVAVLDATPPAAGGVWPTAPDDLAAELSGETPFLGFRRGCRTAASVGPTLPGVALTRAEGAPTPLESERAPAATLATAVADAAQVVRASGLHTVALGRSTKGGGGRVAWISSAEVLWNSSTRGDAGLEPALEGGAEEGGPCPPREWRELAADAVLVESPGPMDVRRLWINSCTVAAYS